jgi:hypothetical protein
MCKNCDCKKSDKPIQYKCNCNENECDCGIIEFDTEPQATPYCCGMPMKKIK